MDRKRTINILTHTFFWIIFIALPLFILPKPSEFINSSNSNIFLYLILTLLLIAFFYFNYSITVPKLYFKKKYLAFILAIVGFLIISVILPKVLMHIFLSTDDLNYEKSEIIRYYFLRFFIILVVSLVLRYRQRLKQIESAKIKSELSSLKAQINPHFLFNTLNSIYGQAITKSEQTANSISKLSTIMRYVLTETNTEKVSLDKEIKYIESYIDLQKMRLTDKTSVVFEVIGNTGTKQIPPLLFISFIENAFKYGVSNEKETQIIISVSIQENSLVFRVKNDKISNTKQVDSNNIGIENTRRRLDLTYKNKYSLNIVDNDNFFEVNLMLSEI